MKTNKELLEELKELIEPVKEWADLNLNPHQTIIIEHGFVRVMSDEFGFPLKIQD